MTGEVESRPADLRGRERGEAEANVENASMPLQRADEVRILQLRDACARTGRGRGLQRPGEVETIAETSDDWW